MAIQTHKDLMVRVQQGDLQAFELLVETFRTPVFNFIYRMLNREREAAEDLLQEIFMKAYGAREYYEPRTRFSTWLFAIARNHCLNFIKSRSYRQSGQNLPLDEATALPALALAQNARQGSAQPEPVNNLTRRETAGILEQAIARLPDDYKETFVLHAVEGFSHQEIAEILKANPATVRSNYHRALLMLRKTIGPVFAAEGSPS